MTSLRRSLERLTKENVKLLSEDEHLRVDYDEVSYRDIPSRLMSNDAGKGGEPLLFPKCDIFTVWFILTFSKISVQQSLLTIIVPYYEICS